MLLITAFLVENAERKELSELGKRLVRYAVEERLGVPRPKTVILPGGKPDFEEGSGLHFSVSHSGGRVLVGVSEGPIGVDIERRREVKKGWYERLFSPEMRENFDYFTGWTLRESYFKLTGEGNLMTLNFTTENGRIITPRHDVFARTYGAIPGFAASVCSLAENFAEMEDLTFPT